MMTITFATANAEVNTWSALVGKRYVHITVYVVTHWPIALAKGTFTIAALRTI